MTDEFDSPSLWQREQPNSYNAVVESELLRLGFMDTSWHNDMCASFTLTVTGGKLRVWVDHIDPVEREDEQSPRFSVFLYDDEMDDVVKGPAAVEVHCESYHAMRGFLRGYLGV